MRFERGGFGGRRFGGGRGGFGRGGGFRSDNRFSDEPKPVKVGEEYDVEISETGSRGDGIARVNNFVVFVNGAKQGEKTKIKITDVRNRFAIGEKVGGSTDSVEPASPAEDSVAEVAAEEGEDEESDESGEGSEESETKEE